MNKTALLLGSILVLAAILCAISIRQKLQHDEYRQGEVYSVEDEKGYRIAKILAVDSRAVHIRLYKNVFSGRPVNVDFKGLTLGSINDPDGFGVGHLPVTSGTFSSWHPVLITRTAVSQEELEGYEEWKKSKGGAFGETN